MLKCITDLKIIRYISFDNKEIIVEFTKKNNRKSATLIFVISLIAIKTQKYIMYCRLKKSEWKQSGLKAHFKSDKLRYWTAFEVQNTGFTDILSYR